MRREEFVGKLEISLRHGPVLVGHEIAERTAVGMAERLAAVHAARSLFLQLLIGKRALDFVPVALALVRRTVDVVYAVHIRATLAQAVPTPKSPTLLHLL